MAKAHRIAVIPGDGIGKEVVPEGVRALEAAGKKFGIAFQWDEFPWSCDYYVKYGRMMPEDWFEQIHRHDAIFFGAVGTAGQRCTSTRRVIAHQSVVATIREKLLAAYKSLQIGNPLDRETVMGPMIDKGAVDAVQQSIQRLKDEGGEVLYGGERLEGEKFQGGCYMKPCLATAKPGFEIVQHETFGPLLYLMTYRDFDEAMSIHNDVPVYPPWPTARAERLSTL